MIATVPSVMLRLLHIVPFICFIFTEMKFQGRFSIFFRKKPDILDKIYLKNEIIVTDNNDDDICTKIRIFLTCVIISFIMDFFYLVQFNLEIVVLIACNGILFLFSSIVTYIICISYTHTKFSVYDGISIMYYIVTSKC